MNYPYLPKIAEVVNRVDESGTVFTLDLKLIDQGLHESYAFDPGQFNMLYARGAGEIPISVSSDPEQRDFFSHTIRIVGKVSGALARLQPGDVLGLRGPYGRGWPLAEAEGRDIVVVTGGLGCAPAVSVVNYVLKRRKRYGRLVIMQGVLHAEELIWRERYIAWNRLPETQVLLSADNVDPNWPWHGGRVTVLFDKAEFDHENCMVYMCGPEPMMIAGAKELISRGIPETRLWLSMERNMHCAVGHCGHCQFGPYFVCGDGPVFCYADIKWLLGTKGF